MSRRNALKYLIPAVKFRLNSQLTAVENLDGTVEVLTFESAAEFNQPLPYVIIGKTPQVRTSDTTNTLGNVVELWLSCYSDSVNQGVFEVESIVDAVVGALEYKAPNGARSAIGVRLDVPGFVIIGAESVRIDGAATEDDKDAHRRIVVMQYYLNQME